MVHKIFRQVDSSEIEEKLSRMWTLRTRILFFGLLGFTLGEKAIDCPKTCPANVYKPICSRGKSYANLCVLKLEICKGNIQPEIYQDIEACPGFDKLEDENGASVEMIDKNGVIFRGLFNGGKYAGTNEEIEPRRKYDRKYLPYHFRRRQLKKRLCSTPCSSRIPQLPVCVLGIQYMSPCIVKRLVCNGKLPLAAIAVMEYCEDESEEIDNSDGKSRLDHWLDNFELSSFRNVNQDETTTDECPESCDRNEYTPVCANGRAFQSDCQLKRAVCKGEFPRELLDQKRPCPKFDKIGEDAASMNKHDILK